MKLLFEVDMSKFLGNDETKDSHYTSLGFF